MNSFTSKCSIKKYRVENPIKPNSLRLVTPKEWNSSGIRIVFSYWHTGLNNILILTWFCLVWNQQFSKHVFTSFENYLRISNKLQKINQLKRNIIKRNEMIQNPSTNINSSSGRWEKRSWVLYVTFEIEETDIKDLKLSSISFSSSYNFLSDQRN